MIAQIAALVSVLCATITILITVTTISHTPWTPNDRVKNYGDKIK